MRKNEEERFTTAEILLHPWTRTFFPEFIKKRLPILSYPGLYSPADNESEAMSSTQHQTPKSAEPKDTEWSPTTGELSNIDDEIALYLNEEEKPSESPAFSFKKTSIPNSQSERMLPFSRSERQMPSSQSHKAIPYSASQNAIAELEVSSPPPPGAAHNTTTAATSLSARNSQTSQGDMNNPLRKVASQTTPCETTLLPYLEKLYGNEITEDLKTNGKLKDLQIDSSTKGILRKSWKEREGGGGQSETIEK